MYLWLLNKNKEEFDETEMEFVGIFDSLDKALAVQKSGESIEKVELNKRYGDDEYLDCPHFYLMSDGRLMVAKNTNAKWECV